MARSTRKTAAPRSTRRVADAAPAPPKTPREERPQDESAAGSESLFQRFLPRALALPANEVVPYRFDIGIALANVQRGVEVVLAERDRLAAELPRISLGAIEALPDLGLATTFAVAMVTRYASVPKNTPALLVRASHLRRLMLGSAEPLAAAGVLPAAAVAKIRAGRGKIDTAGDCVALSTLFKRHAAAVRGKTPVTAAEVREAAEVGTALLAVLQPAGTRKRRAQPELARAVDERDRLWTLFARTWEQEVWRAGAWLFGRAVEDHVPSLQARVAPARKPKAQPGGGAPA